MRFCHRYCYSAIQNAELLGREVMYSAPLFNPRFFRVLLYFPCNRCSRCRFFCSQSSRYGRGNGAHYQNPVSIDDELHEKRDLTYDGFDPLKSIPGKADSSEENRVGEGSNAEFKGNPQTSSNSATFVSNIFRQQDFHANPENPEKFIYQSAEEISKQGDDEVMENLVGFEEENDCEESYNGSEHFQDNGSGDEYTGYTVFGGYNRLESEANKIHEILQKDSLGFDVKEALRQLGFRMTVPLVRRVLLKINSSIDPKTMFRNAKLGFKFFVWAGQQEGYKHCSETYNLLMKIFLSCRELKAMWRLLDEMMTAGCPITARTFHLLVCSCGESGMSRRVVGLFLQSKNFHYRPYKHSYNAIMVVLARERHYRLVEWVYHKMLDDECTPDIFTYNILVYAKFKLGKLTEFHTVLEAMGKNGCSPNLHTYNILLHVLGRGDKPLAAANLMNYMIEAGCPPCIIHFTSLIDGLSRAGNLEACKYFYSGMFTKGIQPDVVCYTTMITAFVVADDLENAQLLFNEMIQKGQLPNVYTYNSMIHGLCAAGKFDEACEMLKIMESRNCRPNFLIYSTLVKRLRRARKMAQAQEIIKCIQKEGKYAHLLPMIMRYKR